MTVRSSIDPAVLLEEYLFQFKLKRRMILKSQQRF